MKNILMRGGGDLASGVALRLHRSGFHVIITELPQPLAVRRKVSFCEAIFDNEITVEGVLARRADTPQEALDLVKSGIIPVLVDPPAAILNDAKFDCLVDARLLKKKVETRIPPVSLAIGLGPGFVCGENCHAAIETMRGHYLGRVYWQGSAMDDTGQPEGDARRVLRAPADGTLIAYADIGDHIQAGQVLAEISSQKIIAPFAGILRGLIRPGLFVRQGVKIGDIDQRDQPQFCLTVSDKALAIGGGVLEAILSFPGLHS